MANEFDTKEGRKWLVSMLAMGPVDVTFIKKSGEERKMTCTLKEDLTETYEKKTDKVKVQNEEVCPVFDLDKKEWRSFRFDSIKRIRFDL